MNQLPAYEQWIAENIEGIDVPDMADAIWNRIEAVLDVEMPVNQNPQQAPSKGNAFFNNPVVLIVTAGIVAIIITLFILLRHNKPQTPPAPPPVPQQQIPAPSPEISPQKDPVIHDSPAKPATSDNIGNVKRIIDTAVYTPVIDKRDSVSKHNKDSLRLPVIKPSIGIMKEKEYGIKVPDSGYRMTTGKEQ